MKKNGSQHIPASQRSEYASPAHDAEILKSSLLKSSNASLLSLNEVKLTDIESSISKLHKGDLTKKNFETSYLQLTLMIQEAYLEAKHQIREDSSDCFLLLKKSIPLDEDDEATIQTDPMILFQYFKQIFEKNYDLRKEAESQLADQKENGVNDYEAMLQKLEAEVRQHIRIEQQLKLYVESTQAKLDELEKTSDPNQLEELKKENQELRAANMNLTEKLRKRVSEMEACSKDLNHKNDIIKKLEQQVEAIPSLRNKIRELETIVAHESFKTLGANTLRTYNRNSKENESLAKIIGPTNNGLTVEGKSRKSSQPFLGMQLQDMAKKKGYDKERNKENCDMGKLELVKCNGDMNKAQYDSFGMNSDQNRNERISAPKCENYNLKTSRQTERSEEFRPASKNKKIIRSESSTNLHRDKSKVMEYDAYSEERMVNLRMLGNTVNSDMIEQSKFGSDRLVMVNSGHSEESHKRAQEKRRDSKSRNEHRDVSELGNPSSSRQKLLNSSRPSTSYERQSYCPDFYKLKKDNEGYELSKLKVLSPKKGLQDRSQSVDAKTRFYKELKSRGEGYDKFLEDKLRRKSVFNVQNRQQNTFNASHRASGVF